MCLLEFPNKDLPNNGSASRTPSARFLTECDQNLQTNFDRIPSIPPIEKPPKSEGRAGTAFPCICLRKSTNQNLQANFDLNRLLSPNTKGMAKTIPFVFGGSEGIRTPEPVKTTRFPIVPVMTASIRFHY